LALPLPGEPENAPDPLEEFKAAARMYREMDMSFWLEKAEAELGSPLGTHSEPR
jgi:hypothetical protein